LAVSVDIHIKVGEPVTVSVLQYVEMKADSVPVLKQYQLVEKE